jgi:hypothetical protein
MGKKIFGNMRANDVRTKIHMLFVHRLQIKQMCSSCVHETLNLAHELYNYEILCF